MLVAVGSHVTVEAQMVSIFLASSLPMALPTTIPSCPDLYPYFEDHHHIGLLARRMFLAEIQAQPKPEQLPTPVKFLHLLDQLTLIAKMCAEAWESKSEAPNFCCSCETDSRKNG